jgi:hypothetical protein
MLQLLVALMLVSAATDTTSATDRFGEGHSREVLISTLIGVACIGGMAVYHMKANDAYDAYLESETMSSALEEWDRVRRYDNIRNILAIGAVAFVARAVYYQLKPTVQRSSTGIKPLIDFQYARNSKLILGLEKSL